MPRSSSGLDGSDHAMETASPTYLDEDGEYSNVAVGAASPMRETQSPFDSGIAVTTAESAATAVPDGTPSPLPGVSLTAPQPSSDHESGSAVSPIGATAGSRMLAGSAYMTAPPLATQAQTHTLALNKHNLATFEDSVRRGAVPLRADVIDTRSFLKPNERHLMAAAAATRRTGGAATPLTGATGGMHPGFGSGYLDASVSVVTNCPPRSTNGGSFAHSASELDIDGGQSPLGAQLGPGLEDGLMRADGTTTATTSAHRGDGNREDSSAFGEPFSGDSLDVNAGSPLNMNPDALSKENLQRHLKKLTSGSPVPLTGENIGPALVTRLPTPAGSGARHYRNPNNGFRRMADNDDGADRTSNGTDDPSSLNMNNASTAAQRDPASTVMEPSEASPSEMASSVVDANTLRDRLLSVVHSDGNMDDLWSTASTRARSTSSTINWGSRGALQSLSKQNLQQLRRQLESGETPLRPEVLAGLSDVAKAMNSRSEVSPSMVVEVPVDEEEADAAAAAVQRSHGDNLLDGSDTADAEGNNRGGGSGGSGGSGGGTARRGLQPLRRPRDDAAQSSVSGPLSPQDVRRSPPHSHDNGLGDDDDDDDDDDGHHGSQDGSLRSKSPANRTDNAPSEAGAMSFHSTFVEAPCRSGPRAVGWQRGTNNSLENAGRGARGFGSSNADGAGNRSGGRGSTSAANLSAGGLSLHNGEELFGVDAAIDEGVRGGKSSDDALTGDDDEPHNDESVLMTEDGPETRDDDIRYLKRTLADLNRALRATRADQRAMSRQLQALTENLSARRTSDNSLPDALACFAERPTTDAPPVTAIGPESEGVLVALQSGLEELRFYMCEMQRSQMRLVQQMEQMQAKDSSAASGGSSGATAAAAAAAASAAAAAAAATSSQSSSGGGNVRVAVSIATALLVCRKEPSLTDTPESGPAGSSVSTSSRGSSSVSFLVPIAPTATVHDCRVEFFRRLREHSPSSVNRGLDADTTYMEMDGHALFDTLILGADLGFTSVNTQGCCLTVKRK